MKRLALALAVVVSVGCMSDVRLLRKTNATYAAEVARHDRKCVNIPEPKAPAECPAQEAELTATYEELLGYMRAFLLGPLPPSARTRLEQIQHQYEPEPKK